MTLHWHWFFTCSNTTFWLIHFKDKTKQEPFGQAFESLTTHGQWLCLNPRPLPWICFPLNGPKPQTLRTRSSSKRAHSDSPQLMHRVGPHQSCHVTKPNAMWLMQADTVCHKATYQIANLKEKEKKNQTFFVSEPKLTKHHIFFRRCASFKRWGIFLNICTTEKFSVLTGKSQSLFSPGYSQKTREGGETRSSQLFAGSGAGRFRSFQRTGFSRCWR